MEYKCPGCGNIISKELDATDCHSCGESLIDFWKKIDVEEKNKAAEIAKNNILSEMQECIDNLEKGFQELMTVKLNSSTKIYYNKIATENSPAQFSEYADKDEYKSVYKKLSSKYETFTTLLNQKIKSGKTVKLAITAAAIVVVLIAGISVLSIMTRKDTNVIVKGGDQNLNVNVNNNAGSNATSSTDVNSQNGQNSGTNVNINNDIKVDANGNRSKYQSYVFESADQAVTYFITTKDWKEKIKCCNYPDSAAVLLNVIKAKKGDLFLSYNKISKKEKLENGGMKYTITGAKEPIQLIVSTAEYGYRIALWDSIYPFGFEKAGFYVDKSKSNKNVFNGYFFLNTDFKGSDFKHNSNSDYELLGYWKDGNMYSNLCNYVCVPKNSKAGKKAFDILKDGGYHYLEIDITWDDDNYRYTYKGNEKTDPEIIVTDVKQPVFDVGYVKYNESLFELEQNFVPAPKL
ncbi:MAG: hypothetical protein MJ182_07800 [Treponema sp.]|nr:hypothetical protein [Treponema sp.]